MCFRRQTFEFQYRTIHGSMESWPIEPLARANKKYAHTPLDEETIKPTSFSSGEELFAFVRGFYGLKLLYKTD